MSARVRLRFMAILLVCGAIPSFAAGPTVVCSPFVPHTRSVGNTTTDASCTDDTIQSAIDNTVCPNTTIFITKERSYTAQHLTIQDKSLTLSGTSTSCGGVGGTRPDASPDATLTAPVVTLDGSGNGGHSVLAVRGASNVTLQFVELTHGNSGGGNGHGGGVDFQANGSLTIDTSTIDLNAADFGGGIEFSGVGGNATLTLKPYSVIESNTANSNGGGINLEGSALLIATQPFTLIGFNHAPNGYGGGLAVVSPATANIGSPGYGTLPVIDGNDAVVGGGISVRSIDSNASANVIVNLFTTDATHPVTLSGNFAAQFGGAVYLKSLAAANTAGGGSALLCAADFKIDGNAAPEGAALYLDLDTSLGRVNGSLVTLNRTTSLACNPQSGAVRCAGGIDCGTLDDNRAVDSLNHPTSGAVIYSDESAVLASRILLRHNSAKHALHFVSATFEIDSSLIVDDDFSAETLRFDTNGDDGSSRIDNVTIANNTHNSGSIVHTDYALQLTRSILDQPAMSSLNLGGTPPVIAEYLLAADPTGLPAGTGIAQGEPLFADPAHGNYHQRVFATGTQVTASLGVDTAPLLSGETIDIDGNPRDTDVPGVPNVAGVRDLGALEEQPILDRVFVDAFGDPVSLVF